MPPLPTLRIGALEELAKQLRFAPSETLRRQLERAEQLAAEIDPAVNYPEDWVVFRVTGYRAQIETPATFVGEALLGDLSALVERLSAAAKLSESELNGGGGGGAYLSSAALRERWRVSAKTLERYRRMGLIARRVVGGNGRSRLVFAVTGVERFEAGQKARLESAKGYSRIEPELRAKMIRRAGAYRRRLRWTLNKSARRLAERFGRGHETVRQLLRHHDAAEGGGGGPIFGEPGPPSVRERRLIELAYWRAVEPKDIAERVGRSGAAVQRAINDARARRLRLLLAEEGGPLDPQAERSANSRRRVPPKGAEGGAAGLQDRFGRSGATDLLALIQESRETPPVPAAHERATAELYRSLLGRATQAIAMLPEHGAKASVLDRAETDLRWATRLKAELIHSQLPLLVRTLEATLGRPLEEVRGSLLLPLVQEAIAALAAGVEAFEGGRGGRLAAPSGLALTRVATRFARENATALGIGPGRARATSRLAPGVAIEDWTRTIAAWQLHRGRVWLEPDARVRAGLARLDERLRAVLERRYGWGAAPGTLPEVARALSTTPMAIARLERRGVREAIALARASQP